MGRKIFVKLVLITIVMAVFGVSCKKSRWQRLREEERVERAKYIQARGLPDSLRTASGLYYIEEKKGEGDTIAWGDQVYVWYTGYLLDSTIFASNEDDGRFEPLDFTMDPRVNQVAQGLNIPQGWYEGVKKMRDGGKAELIIPSNLAYGRNMYLGIPSYSTLRFKIEVYDVRKPN